MNLIGRLLVLVLLSAGFIALGWRFSSAQNGASKRHALPAERIQHKASKAARLGDASSIRALTDEVLEAHVPSGVAKSLKDRLFKTELAFRNGAHPPIYEDNFVDTINTTVRRYGGPDYLTTNLGQVRRFRRSTRTFIPDLVVDPASRLRRDSIGSEMSPAETVLTAVTLGLIKLAHPDYHVPPDQSEARLKAQDASGKEPGPSRSAVLHGRVDTGKSAAVPLAMWAAMRDESSDAVHAAHTVLDLLGFHR